MQLSFLTFGVLFFYCISLISWFESQKCMNKSTDLLSTFLDDK